MSELVLLSVITVAETPLFLLFGMLFLLLQLLVVRYRLYRLLLLRLEIRKELEMILYIVCDLRSK
ncbi:hypothetical protein Hdeb2414_s0014g00431961 [Helianthus debilis subsp. tardiflorus]